MASPSALRCCRPAAQVLAALLAWTCGVAVLLSVGAPRAADAALTQKPGACPPPPAFQVCDFTCYGDFDCYGSDKCCRTLCGGSACLRAVSPPRQKPKNETGECPPLSTTPWVCGSRCSVDQDCIVGKKCCPHRCGGFACLRALPPRPPPVAPGAGDGDPRFPGAPVRFN